MSPRHRLRKEPRGGCRLASPTWRANLDLALSRLQLMVAQVSGRRRRAKLEERNQCQEILKKLESLSDPAAVAGMTRFGINPRNTYGVSIPELRKLVRQIGRSHRLG